MVERVHHYAWEMSMIHRLHQILKPRPHLQHTLKLSWLAEMMTAVGMFLLWTGRGILDQSAMTPGVLWRPTQSVSKWSVLNNSSRSFHSFQPTWIYPWRNSHNFEPFWRCWHGFCHGWSHLLWFWGWASGVWIWHSERLCWSWSSWCLLSWLLTWTELLTSPRPSPSPKSKPRPNQTSTAKFLWAAQTG